MSTGYIDPISKKYVKGAGAMTIWNTPVSTESQAGLMSAEDKKKLDRLSEQTIASEETINSLFN